jgi:hypothetical protein
MLVMPARSLLLLLLSLLTSCGNQQVITNKTPFQNLECDLGRSDFARLQRMSANFAETEGLRYSLDDYSVWLTNERLNFVLAKRPDMERVFATAIARSKPTSREEDLFRRFIAVLKLKCAPAAVVENH